MPTDSEGDMGMRRKGKGNRQGARKINVDGRDYRWIVSAAQSDLPGRAVLNLTVECDTDRGGRLHANHLCHEHPAFLEPICVVTPGQVAEIIRQVIEMGWLPEDSEGKKNFKLPEFGARSGCYAYEISPD